MAVADELALGVLGCGRFGRGLAAAFAETPRVRVVACADQDREAAAACAAKIPRARAVSPDELLAAQGLDAVAVATPNAAHRACVEQVLAARRHVWCEKPMALSVPDCDAMLAAAAAAGVRFTVGHMQRHFPLLAEVRQAVAGGAVGAPRMVALTRREHLHRDPGWLRRRELVGGLPFQSSVHEYDWLRSAFGEVVRVSANAVWAPLQPHLDYPDGILAQFDFASGCVGALQACMTDFVPAYRGEINGPQGSLHFDLLAGAMRLGRPGAGVQEISVSQGALSEAYGPGGLRARLDFVAWILDDTPPAVTAWDGRQAVAIACAVAESLAIGLPVSLH